MIFLYILLQFRLSVYFLRRGVGEGGGGSRKEGREVTVETNWNRNNQMYYALPVPQDKPVEQLMKKLREFNMLFC